MALQEIRHRRRLVRRGLWFYKGTRTFICMAQEAIAAADSLYGTVFPNMSGSRAPVMYDPEIIWDPGNPPVVGTAMIIARYVTPGATILPAGQATLYTRPIRKKWKRTVDVNGRIIEGFQDRKHEWRVVRGDNTVFDYNLLLRLDTTYGRSLDYLAYSMDLMGKVNDNYLQKFGEAPRGTILFHGAHRRRQKVERRIQVSYIMEFNPLGWNNSVESQNGLWEAIVTEARDDTDVTDSEPFPVRVGDTKTVLRYLPGYRENPNDATNPVRVGPEPRQLFLYADFRRLHNLEFP